MPFTPLAGWNSRVRIGTYILHANKWSANDSVDELDVTNFEGAGYSDVEDGVSTLELTIDAEWNASENPHDSPPGIYAGNNLANVRCYIKGTTGPAVYLPLCKILGVPITCEVRGKISYQFRVKNKGIFYLPTGNAVA